ncbi:MAG TPA: hypothetical protein VD884_09940 [Ohtaekwangia sp.]|nr:hypothetical protein [Ohtaekwangia sp.]
MRLYLVCFFMLVVLLVKAQPEPKWINYTLRTNMYPSAEYLTGFASEINTQNVDQNELLSKLEGVSKNQLVENIMVDIRSISTLNIHNVNSETQETFRHNSTSFSQAKVSGLKTERYYDVKKKTGYAFSYALKRDVIKLYTNEIDQKLAEIRTAITSAKSLDKQNSLKKYFTTQSSFRTIEEAQTLISTLTAKYDDATLKRAQVNELKLQVDEKINALRNSNQLSLDEAAGFLAFGLSLQTGQLSKSLRLANFTYRDTPMASPFSRKLRNVLEQTLVTESKYNVVNETSRSQGFVLTGTYWEDKDKLKVTSLLRDEITGDAIASASCYIPLSSLSDIAFMPENYHDAMVNMKVFARDEMKGGELQVEVMTNKGKDGEIYDEGEIMKLFVRTNRECYVRFIYHLADGSKVLLLDNYYINRDNVNLVYELPYTFECAEPFGVETLQVNAQTAMFEPLTTHHADGYEFIDENTEQILVKTRGFKRKDDEILKAEKIMVITTMKSL